MLRLRPYKSCDSKHIADWIKNEETFVKWGGERFGSYPINAKIIDDKYRLNNGDCVEEDNFYPMTAFDDSGVVGHFIMRYINGNNKILRFGWVIVDDAARRIQDNCIGCHKELVSQMLANSEQYDKKSDATVQMGRRCWECHRHTPHGRMRNLTATQDNFIVKVN